MMKKGGLTLYCFSPPVMIATFTLELLLFIYTVIRYRMSTSTRLIAAILLLLAIFQISEFNVCAVFGVSAVVWSRIGYFAITLLPALAVHLVLTIAGQKWRWLVALSYLISGFFAAIFGFSKTAFVNHLCSGNYVIFRLANGIGGTYFAYYYAWLVIGIALCLYLSNTAKPRIRTALLLQIVGYLSFLLPTGIVNTLNPQTVNGIPSVMCGFAILYALILVFAMAPLTLKPR